MWYMPTSEVTHSTANLYTQATAGTTSTIDGHWLPLDYSPSV